jgi:hypothetical protein
MKKQFRYVRDPALTQPETAPWGHTEKAVHYPESEHHRHTVDVPSAQVRVRVVSKLHNKNN